VSSQIKARRLGPLPIDTAQAFLDGICESEAIVWYFDGAKLYFSAASEIESMRVYLGPLGWQEFSNRLRGLGIADSHYPLTPT
jgi:hypothetical protein